jgi:hypothetical protein
MEVCAQHFAFVRSTLEKEATMLIENVASLGKRLERLRKRMISEPSGNLSLDCSFRSLVISRLLNLD